MSHVTPIEREDGWDIEVLKEMCASTPGWQFMQGQTSFAWFGRHMGDYPIPAGYSVEDMGKCNHAIQIEGAKYEIGVVQKNGKVDLMWDFWRSGGLQEVLGEKAGLLKRNYDFAKAKRAARMKGKTFQEAPATARGPGWRKAVVYL